ncbi:hypothetical protein J2S41_001185 [Catenuloplanes atrovinosus]|uniref:Uncharacterized protein n=1 Tax=Catenuloplanes atrovinosus TaxID=137266 RepID=A0AAE4C892_9ACTN|nr:hypothetical protein [Catenuloplanes atrovinosus]
MPPRSTWLSGSRVTFRAISLDRSPCEAQARYSGRITCLSLT